MTEAPAYQAILSRAPAEEGDYFILSYAEIPGCFGVGQTEAEATDDGRRALIAVLDALKAVDRPPPPTRRASG
jgi:antitoxin HicB